jgi:MATE family multidrug resistance protein
VSKVDPVVVGHAVTFLGYAAAFQVADGVQVAANASLRGLKDTRIPMLVSLVSYWGFGVSTSWLLGVRFGMEGRGVWLGLVVGLTVAAVALVVRFMHLSRPKASTSPPAAPAAPTQAPSLG